jgi:PhnB protein
VQSEYQGIVPYLFFDDAETAIDWYSKHFGFEEIGRWMNDSGKVANAEMKVGNTEVWIDGSGKLQKSDERPIWIGIWVEDVDKVYQQLLANGVQCEAPVTREFGVQMLTVDDGMGHLWGFIRRTG